MSRGPNALERAEIVTGERLQGLAETTLLPRAIAIRQRPVRQDGPGTVCFDEHRSIGREGLRLLSASRSLFVYTHALALFQKHVWPRLTGKGYVLITHNSDHEVGTEQLPWVEAAGDMLARWFSQNLLAEHPKLTPLPIGVANSVWDHGEVRALCATMGSVEQTDLVYARFDARTHPDRQRAWEAVRRAFPGTSNKPKRFEAYLSELARHRFCICPRGNGIDTHRFWECQYLGVMPVLERSPNSEMWVRQGLPMVLLDDWSDLSRERLEAERPQAPRTIPPPLRLSHYARLVRAATAEARAA